MSEREVCILCWAFVAGVTLTLLVLRLREKRRLRQEVMRKYDAWAAAVVEQCRSQERVIRQFSESIVQPGYYVRLIGGVLDGETRWCEGTGMGTRLVVKVFGNENRWYCYIREPGASTARFVAILPFEEAKAWAQREGSAT